MSKQYLLPTPQDLAYNFDKDRLLHSPSLVATGLSVGYETWPPSQLAGIILLWLGGLKIDWDCLVPHCIMGSHDQWEFQLFFRPQWQSLCTALTAGNCLPLGLCRGTVKESMMKRKPVMLILLVLWLDHSSQIVSRPRLPNPWTPSQYKDSLSGYGAGLAFSQNHHLPDFKNFEILLCLYEIKRKNLFKSTCPTGSFTCPRPSGNGKWRALMGISIIKMRRSVSSERLIFIMGIPILIRQHLIRWDSISLYKMRRSSHHFIFIMGIPILVRQHLYIKTSPWLLVSPGHQQPYMASSGHNNSGHCHTKMSACSSLMHYYYYYFFKSYCRYHQRPSTKLCPLFSMLSMVAK